MKAIEIRGVKNPDRFQREINIAKKLDHPNVVRRAQELAPPVVLKVVRDI